MVVKKAPSTSVKLTYLSCSTEEPQLPIVCGRKIVATNVYYKVIYLALQRRRRNIFDFQ